MSLRSIAGRLALSLLEGDEDFLFAVLSVLQNPMFTFLSPS